MVRNNQTRKITKVGTGKSTDGFKNFEASTMINNIRNSKQMRGYV